MSQTIVVAGTVPCSVAAQECIDKGFYKDDISTTIVYIEDIKRLRPEDDTMPDQAWMYATEHLGFEPAEVVALIAFEHEWVGLDGDISAQPHVFEHDSIFPRLAHRIMIQEQPAGVSS